MLLPPSPTFCQVRDTFQLAPGEQWVSGSYFVEADQSHGEWRPPQSQMFADTGGLSGRRGRRAPRPRYRPFPVLLHAPFTLATPTLRPSPLARYALCALATPFTPRHARYPLLRPLLLILHPHPLDTPQVLRDAPRRGRDHAAHRRGATPLCPPERRHAPLIFAPSCPSTSLSRSPLHRRSMRRSWRTTPPAAPPRASRPRSPLPASTTRGASCPPRRYPRRGGRRRCSVWWACTGCFSARRGLRGSGRAGAPGWGGTWQAGRTARCRFRRLLEM